MNDRRDRRAGGAGCEARGGYAAGSVTHSPAAAALRAAGGTRGAHSAGRVPPAGLAPGATRPYVVVSFMNSPVRF